MHIQGDWNVTDEATRSADRQRREKGQGLSPRLRQKLGSREETREGAERRDRRARWISREELGCSRQWEVRGAEGRRAGKLAPGPGGARPPVDCRG